MLRTSPLWPGTPAVKVFFRLDFGAALSMTCDLRFFIPDLLKTDIIPKSVFTAMALLGP